MSGKARLAGPSRVVVARDGAADTTVAFEKAIIASGSLPIFLPEVKPDGRRILAPRVAGNLAEWPEHLIMIGGGVTGAEFAYFFSRMGCRVTWVTDQPAILPRTDVDLAAALEKSLAARGVSILKSAPVAAAQADEKGVQVALHDGRHLDGSHAFIAIGRRPDLADLDLASAGIEHGDQGVVVDGYCRTTCPTIYAVGDAAGPPFVANRAMAQARVAARHALGQQPRAFRPDAVVEATFTSPQLATVGLSEMQAASTGLDVIVRRFGFADTLKARLTGAPQGVVKIIAAAKDGRILGGGAFGAHAADILTPVALAIANDMLLDDLAALFPAYPTISALGFIAARGYAC
jgi:dihydrolipoamide dehydrogenase